MSVDLFRRAVAALLPLALTACASAPPPPLESGHPARPDTAVARPVALETLKSYRDFGAQPASPNAEDGGDDGARDHNAAPPPATEESHDAQKH